MAEPRRLYRSRTDRQLAGVCGGLGEYLEIDPVLIRLAFVLLFFAGGSSLALYAIMWLVVPEGRHDDEDE
jgi:phage shock protein C